MATPEGKIKSKLDKMFKSEGVLYYSPQAGPYGAAGWPDRMLIVCGMFAGVEVKADEKCKPTALQLRIGEKIKEAGAEWFLVYDDATIETVRQWIVSTRSRRQKDTGSSVGEPTGDPGCDPYGEAYPEQAFPFSGSSQPRNYASPT